MARRVGSRARLKAARRRKKPSPRKFGEKGAKTTAPRESR